MAKFPPKANAAESLHEAMASGGRFYNTGEACLRGHIANRYVSSRGCVECSVIYQAVNPEGRRAYRLAHRERNIQYQKEHRALNLDGVRERDRLRPRPDARDRFLRANYGITAHDYNALYSERSGRCDICARHADVLVIDHCHTKGHIRGLLCHSCNMALGSFKDSVEILTMAALYLQQQPIALGKMKKKKEKANGEIDRQIT